MKFSLKMRYFLRHWLYSCQTGIDIPFGQFEVKYIFVTLTPIINFIVWYVGHLLNSTACAL